MQSPQGELLMGLIQLKCVAFKTLQEVCLSGLTLYFSLYCL